MSNRICVYFAVLRVTGKCKGNSDQVTCNFHPVTAKPFNLQRRSLRPTTDTFYKSLRYCLLVFFGYGWRDGQAEDLPAEFFAYGELFVFAFVDGEPVLGDGVVDHGGYPLFFQGGLYGVVVGAGQANAVLMDDMSIGDLRGDDAFNIA